MPSFALRALRALIAAADTASQNQQVTNLQNECCTNVYIASLWAAGIPGCDKAEELASSKLLEISRAAGWEAATPDLCRVTRHMVERHRGAQIVAIKEHDAKRFFDHYTPRIRRNREGLRPLDIVVGDVHPIDILVTREDGSEATARLIAWLDLATNDVHATLILLDKGRGIRQEHIARAFVTMVQDWGLPRALYLDNGSEYQWEEMMEGFRCLVGLTEAFEVFVAEAADIAGMIAEPQQGQAVPVTERRAPAVTRAKPYNAPAKQIEGIFAALEKCLAIIPGWIGGDRMRKRTHRVGAAPKPYPGTWQAFEADFSEALAFYRNTPQRGSLKGRSPHQAWADFIALGWRPLAAPYEVFLVSFARTENPKVKPGGIQVGGAWYYHDALIPFIGRRVQVRHAKWDPTHVLLIRAGDPPIAIPQDQTFHTQDRAGAKEQGRRAGLLNARVKNEKAFTRKIDLLEEVRRHNAFCGPATVLPKGASIALTGEQRAFMDAARAAPAAPPPVRLQPGQFRHPDTGIVHDLAPPEANKPERAENAQDLGEKLLEFYRTANRKERQ